jgi:hypothetical protein
MLIHSLQNWSAGLACSKRLGLGHVRLDKLEHAALAAWKVGHQLLNVRSPLLWIAQRGSHVTASLQQLAHSEHASDATSAHDAIRLR